MLWVNGIPERSLADGHVYYHEHPFNVGQHVAHNAMVDECVNRGVDWHIRMDDDCWISTRTWLKKLLNIQEQIKALTGKYAVLGLNVSGLINPPKPVTQRMHGHQLRNAVIEEMDILGGIFRMSPMSLMRYFRWDERQAMGFGDATQFANLCKNTATDMFRLRDAVHCSHGGSTLKQIAEDATWDYQHDMDQYIPLGL